MPPETQAQLRDQYDIVSARDEENPWNIPGETGRLARQAMNKAINRDEINQAIFRGVGGRQWVATLTPELPAGYHPAWEEKWDELYGYDPERAKELLWTLPASAVVDPNVVAEYIFLGPNNGSYIYLEYVRGVRE